VSRGHPRPSGDPTLRLAGQRLVIVTGKGGVGKSSVAAALASAAAHHGRRALAVEIGRGGLSRLLGVEEPGPEPTVVERGLACVTIDPESALGQAVHGMMPLGMMARRLLESTTFQIVAAAAPGLPEYLVLNRLSAFLDATRLGRPRYELIVVDAPASGHSLPLLGAPRALGALARLGPVAEFLGRAERMLHDAATTAVWIVTTPEELPVREAIELHHALRSDLALTLPPPIVNAFPRRRFTSHDQAAIAEAAARPDLHPYLAGARLEVARQRDAVEQVRVLRSAVRRAPVRLPYLPGGTADAGGLAQLARAVARQAGFGT
jgi:Mrp family chromosome partitioning ATPase